MISQAANSSIQIRSPDSLFDNTRWESYLEVMEDYEYVWLLNATIATLEASGALSAEDASAKRSVLDSLTAAVSRDRWYCCNTLDTIYQSRAAIRGLLDEFTAYTNITTIGEATWDPLW